MASRLDAVVRGEILVVLAAPTASDGGEHERRGVSLFERQLSASPCRVEPLIEKHRRSADFGPEVPGRGRWRADPDAITTAPAVDAGRRRAVMLADDPS